MQRLFLRLAGHRAVGSSLAISSILFSLAAWPAAAADTPYTATGWVIGAPVPGLWQTNALGQVIMRGNAHIVRVDCSDPRLAGRRLIFVDGGAQPDGSALLNGKSYQEVGTWDATGTKFTPAGGLWEISYRGVMQADNSLQLDLVGSGFGGTIDGLRLEETMTRAAASGPIDPVIPYYYTGTIKPPPLSTNLVLDDFSRPAVGWEDWGTQSYSYTRSDGQLIVTGHWPGVITRSVMDSYTLAYPSTRWTVADGQTLEARVGLVSFSDSATWATLVVGGTSGFYGLCKGHDFLALRKWSENQSNFHKAVTVFSYEKVQVPDANVVLALALTRSRTNLLVTIRVLDKGNPGSVLYERSVVDTPNMDPSLTAAELLSVSGMDLAVSADPREAPFTTVQAGIGLFQYNYDGQQPAAIATFDNLELRKSEIPDIGIARAVELSWPASATLTYAVEGAPNLQGPWVPVQESALPGLQQVTVPASETTKFFRLRQAP
ncbi:MAG: hypothetical protein AB9869_03505 [Verrucomicrobiia bacterium]